ncbi:MAG: response regulator [Nitrospirae bacterium]|nr:response regulator [Nitrospirota bacterium]
MTKILIADDESVICDLIKLFLEGKGFQVSVASSGKEAIRLFNSERPNIMILDIGLPDMDGLELLSKVKTASPDTKVIVTTGYSNTEIQQKAFSLGASNYLTKPFDIHDLLRIASH